MHFRSLRLLAFVGVLIALAASPAVAQSATGAGARFEMQLDETGGQSCGAADADDNIVWGTAVVDGSDPASCAQIADDNIVWGTVAQSDNIIWGTFASDDNIVWGTATVSDDNIVWGTVVAADLDEY